jgi:hypothetical protein
MATPKERIIEDNSGEIFVQPIAQFQVALVHSILVLSPNTLPQKYYLNRIHLLAFLTIYLKRQLFGELYKEQGFRHLQDLLTLLLKAIDDGMIKTP